MICYLFRVPYAVGEGFHVRPVAWKNPAILITPMWVNPTPEIFAWLEAYGSPEWNSGFNKEQNCISLYNRLGYWPDPINVAVHEVPREFNDRLPF